jgi:hypothetical protein
MVQVPALWKARQGDEWDWRDEFPPTFRFPGFSVGSGEVLSLTHCSKGWIVTSFDNP